MSSFSGYEYEDWLLSQWGNWARGGGIDVAVGSIWASIVPSTTKSVIQDDGLFERVDGVIARMEKHDKRWLKQWYLSRNYGVVNEDITGAVRRFASVWQ